MDLNKKRDGEQERVIETDIQDPVPEVSSITSPMGKLFCITF